MRLLIEKCTTEGNITIQNNLYPADIVNLEYNEEKYPMGHSHQAKDWLEEKGYKVLAYGWDELNTYYFFVVDYFTNLLKDNQ